LSVVIDLPLTYWMFSDGVWRGSECPRSAHAPYIHAIPLGMQLKVTCSDL